MKRYLSILFEMISFLLNIIIPLVFAILPEIIHSFTGNPKWLLLMIITIPLVAAFWYIKLDDWEKSKLKT